MKVYVVLSADCNEADCGCYLESIDSIWLSKDKAISRAEERYNGRVVRYTIEN